MMSDWFHDLPLVWMAVVVLGFTYLLAGAIHVVVHALAVGERARAFKSVSPGMLPPLGIVFGLLWDSRQLKFGAIAETPARP